MGDWGDDAGSEPSTFRPRDPATLLLSPGRRWTTPPHPTPTPRVPAQAVSPALRPSPASRGGTLPGVSLLSKRGAHHPQRGQGTESWDLGGPRPWPLPRQDPAQVCGSPAAQAGLCSACVNSLGGQCHFSLTPGLEGSREGPGRHPCTCPADQAAQLKGCRAVPELKTPREYFWIQVPNLISVDAQKFLKTHATWFLIDSILYFVGDPWL